MRELREAERPALVALAGLRLDLAETSRSVILEEAKSFASFNELIFWVRFAGPLVQSIECQLNDLDAVAATMMATTGNQRLDRPERERALCVDRDGGEGRRAVEHSGRVCGAGHRLRSFGRDWRSCFAGSVELDGEQPYTSSARSRGID